MARSLKEMITDGEVVVAPACYDALGALLAQAAGFAAVSMSGNAASASIAGAPDINVLTMTEMVDKAGGIARAIDIPLISDADTGYGGTSNVMRTAREFEAAKVAAIHLEDQVFPAAWPALRRPVLVSAQDAAERIAVACAARRSDEFLIIARTDACGVHGLDEAITRGNLYAEAGADLIYIEGMENRSDLEAAGRRVTAPLCLHVGENRSWRSLRPEDFRGTRYRMLLYANAMTLYVAGAMQKFMATLAAEGNFESLVDGMLPRQAYQNVLRSFQDPLPGVGRAG